MNLEKQNRKCYLLQNPKDFNIQWNFSFEVFFMTKKLNILK